MDDPIQFADIEYVSDTNHISLQEARGHFQKIGAASEDVLAETRAPRTAETRDPNWPY